MSLDGAYLRLERAREHIAEGEDLAAQGGFRNFTVAVNTTGIFEDTTNSSWASSQLSIIAGESLYNLRSALDYLAYELVHLDAADPYEETGFPLVEYRRDRESGRRIQFSQVEGDKEFTKQARGRLKGTSAEHRNMVRKWQPYTGHPLLGELNERVNWDKHRRLTVLPAAVEVSTRPDSGNYTVTGIEVISFAPRDGERYRPVLDSLRDMAAEVERVLDSFKEVFGWTGSPTTPVPRFGSEAG